MVRLGSINPQAWDVAVDDIIQQKSRESKVDTFEKVAVDVPVAEEELNFDWRVGAAAKRLDRELFEEYGYMKDFILHPTTQYYKHMIESNCNFNFQWGEPLLPLVPTIILLSMVNGKLGRNLSILLTALLFNVNPLYVLLILALYWMTSNQKHSRQYIQASKAAKKSNLSVKDCVPFAEILETERQFKHVLFGGGINTLVTAAILSSKGHSCCVIIDETFESAEIRPDGAPCPIPTKDFSIGRIHRYQVCMACIILSSGADPHLQQILDWIQSWAPDRRCYFAPTGAATNGFTAAVINCNHDHKHHTFVLRAGENAVAQNLSDNFQIISILTAVIAGSKQAFAHFSGYVFGKVDKVIDATKFSDFLALAQVSIDEYLSRISNSTAQFDSLIAAIGWFLGGSYDSREASAFNIAGLDAMLCHGVFYPVGGPAALERSLIDVIRSCGGVVCRDAVVSGLSISDQGNAISGLQLKCLGGQEHPLACKSAICGWTISYLYQYLASRNINLEELDPDLQSLRTRTRRVSFMYWVSGSVSQLDIQSCDYIEVSTSRSKHTCDNYLKLWSPSAKDATFSGSVTTIIIEFDVEGSEQQLKNFELKAFGAGSCELALRAKAKLLEIYPKCQNNIIFEYIYPQSPMSVELAQTKARYSHCLSCQLPIEGLYSSSSDLSQSGLAGDIQGGWVAAHAVLGFTSEDLLSGQNALRSAN